MNPNAITVRVDSLTKSYSLKGYAIKDISFEVHEGEIFGIIGQNGSGKTTLLECMTGIMPMDMGSVTICGFNVTQDPLMAKRRYGYLPDTHALFREMTGREFLDFMGDMYDVSLKDRNRIIGNMAETFNLTEVLDLSIDVYSNGMKQKLSFIASFLHRPKVWILDEPMNALDVVSSAEITSLFHNQAVDGVSIIFSSQNLFHIESICDRVAILDGGELKTIVDVNRMRTVEGKRLDTLYFEIIGNRYGKISPTD